MAAGRQARMIQIVGEQWFCERCKCFGRFHREAIEKHIKAHQYMETVRRRKEQEKKEKVARQIDANKIHRKKKKHH